MASPFTHLSGHAFFPRFQTVLPSLLLSHGALFPRITRSLSLIQLKSMRVLSGNLTCVSCVCPSVSLHN